jgi:predicted  nucleic acid-binding Zn-ribbon protein
MAKQTQILTKRDVQAFKKKAEALVERIADARDELRDLMSHYETIGDDCDEAIDYFEGGFEAISRLL